MPTLFSKHVRFAFNNIFHSPATPTLSFSGSLSTDSDGPITPPAPTHHLPGPTPFAPPMQSSKNIGRAIYSEPPRSHPLFRTGVLTWDMVLHPASAIHNHRAISHYSLAEPATHPPIPFMRITSPHLPWSIKVYASNGSFVSVRDVLDSIYHSLRVNISGRDFQSLPSNGDRRRATRAYEDRYRRQRSARAYEEEKRGGMKRIDFLMGHSRFVGLSNASHHADEWTITVS